MLRKLFTSVLVALLMTPQFVIAEGHHREMNEPVAADSPIFDDQMCEDAYMDCGQANLVLCCDMIMGHCTSVMNIPGSMAISDLAGASAQPYDFKDLVHRGRIPAFDPPPPRA